MRRVPLLIALATMLASCSSITDPDVAELPEITVGPETTTPSAAESPRDSNHGSHKDKSDFRA